MITFCRKKEKTKNLLIYLTNNDIFVYSVFGLVALFLAISIWLFFPVSSSGYTSPHSLRSFPLS